METVQVKKLDDIVDCSELEPPVLLKTDYQGGDFEVVKGGVHTLKQCEMVIMEFFL